MDEAREDDGRLDGLYNRPGYMMRRCVQTFTGVFHETCAELGLTIRQYDFLYVLDAYETVDQDHLARALGLDRSTTGLVVAILERKRLIERQVKPSDRRKRSLTITPDFVLIASTGPCVFAPGLGSNVSRWLMPPPM